MKTPMSMRQLRKYGYRKIFKEGASHQEVYEDLKNSTTESPEEIATALTMIPSRKKNDSLKNLWMTYSALLGIMIILRILTVISLALMNDFNPSVILILVLLGIAYPAYGIYGAFAGKYSSYSGMIMIMLLNVFRFFRDGSFEPNIYTFGVFGLIGAIIVLAIIIMRKMKMKYTVSVVKEEVNGKMKSRKVITFEDSEPVPDEDLLDTSL